MHAHSLCASDVLRGVVEEHAGFRPEIETAQCQFVDVGIRLVHLLHTRHHRALQQLLQLREPFESKMERLVRPIRQPPHAVACSLQITKQLFHIRNHAGERIAIAFDVIAENFSDLLTLLAYHVGINVFEIFAMVHTILIIVETARIIICANTVHNYLGVPAFKACARLPVDEHAAKIKDHIGDVGTGGGHENPSCKIRIGNVSVTQSNRRWGWYSVNLLHN